MIKFKANLDDRTMRVLNRVKREQGFKNISQAIEYILTVYEAELLDPALRPTLKKR